MAVEPTAILVLDAIVAQLQTVDGTGDWNFDLSGSGTVYLDERVVDPNHSPCSVVIGPAHVNLDDALTTPFLKGRSMTMHAYCFVPGNDNDYAARLKQALRLQQDVSRVLDDMQAFRVAVSAQEANRGNAVVSIDTSQHIATGLRDGKIGSAYVAITITFDRLITGGGI